MNANKNKLLAAGILPICLTTERMLLSKRREGVDFGGTWASWGGKFEEEKGDVTIKDCARREFREETLIIDDYHFVEDPVHVYEDHRVIYYTFIGFFNNEIKPNVVEGGELDGYQWVNLNEIPEPLMPEFDIMLRAELPKIKKMIAQMKEYERENDKFHSDIDMIFESYLKVEETPVIRIAKKGKVVTKMNYKKVVFDSDLNIYKCMPDGTLSKIDDPDFKAVVVVNR